ncbi:MAG: TIGR00282 family metallophosphoesterase [Rhodospirillaceae bacterium]|nr:TIGR00282 family metallophosphoesterase [Rhodospirillaceae bacterium]
MRILYCGDIVGRSGRDAVIKHLPDLRDRLSLDFVAVNGENAAHGFGITADICKQVYNAGADCILLGNHAWDQREIIGYIDSDPRLIRPINYPPGTPGRGETLIDIGCGRKVYVLQVMARLFMDPLDDPFAAAAAALATNRLKQEADAILVDMHGEATSEKMSFGHFLDGRASLVAGTHTHVPTADAQILDGGTAYITDVGMCGDYDSVIGMKKAAPIDRFRRKMPGERLGPATGDGTLCAVYVETDDATGLAARIAPVRVGPRLANAMPDVAAA